MTRHDVEQLQTLAAGTARHRVRLCAHQDTADALHEMLIVLDSATYVRPHRHPGKSESFHMIAGALRVVIFREDGEVADVIRMGDYASGRPFYYRLAEPAYHTVLPERERVVFHETTNGPFRREDTEFAPWAPAEENAEAARLYLHRLARDTTALTFP